MNEPDITSPESTSRRKALGFGLAAAVGAGALAVGLGKPEIASAAGVGGLVLSAPTRIFDSASLGYTPGPGAGLTISTGIANQDFALLSVTAYGQSGAGYLMSTPVGGTWPTPGSSPSVLNWGAANWPITNTLPLWISSGGQLYIVVGPTCSTHVIVERLGYVQR